MDLFIVMVRIDSSFRYIDSMWVDKAHADQRSADLTGEFKRIGHALSMDGLGWWVWVHRATVTDGKLA